MSSCAYCGAEAPPGATRCPTCGQPVAGPAATPPAAGTSASSKRIAIVAIAAGCFFLAIFGIGILAALIIPNYLDAMEKAKLKRTIGDLREIATQLESHRAVADSYPADVAALGAALAARGYQRALTDSWQHPLRYTCLVPAGEGCESYELASPGKDGLFEREPGSYEPGRFASDADIVVRDGQFVRFPPVSPQAGGPP